MIRRMAFIVLLSFSLLTTTPLAVSSWIKTSNFFQFSTGFYLVPVDKEDSGCHHPRNGVIDLHFPFEQGDFLFSLSAFSVPLMGFHPCFELRQDPSQHYLLVLDQNGL